MNSHSGPTLAQRLRGLDRALVAALTAVALLRPLFSVVGWSESLGKPLTPLLLTLVISLVWLGAVMPRRVADPVLTLLVTGVAYALVVLVGSAVLSPLLDGELRGPLARPPAIVPLFAVNAAWGALCGAAALGLRRARGVRD